MEHLLDDNPDLDLVQQVRGMVQVPIDRLLVWAYRDQQADIALGRSSVANGGSYEYLGYSRDSVVVVERFGMCGSMDGGGVSFGDVHPDADQIHRAVLGLDRMERGLVIYHARNSSHPDWMPDAVPKLGPKLRENGKPERILDAKGRVIGSRIQWIVLPENINAARAGYVAWYNALLRIVVACIDSCRMTSFVPLPPSVPLAPWENRNASDRAAPRIIPSMIAIDTGVKS